ncbi:L domain-like protein, partial [Rhizoclosmatium globosum]
LTVLSLPYFISGPFPEVVCELTNLTTLNLIGNNLEGSIPAGIGHLTSLQNLNLQQNSLVGPIPQEIGKLINLYHLNLENNKLTGEIPRVVGNLKRLNECWLSKNELSGPIPAEFGGLPILRTLDLKFNQLFGPIPDSISLHEKLGFLTICQGQLAHPFSHGFVDNLYSQFKCHWADGQAFHLEERTVEGSDATLFYAIMRPHAEKGPFTHIYKLKKESEE